MDARKTVLILGGGAMSGVFGAGFVTALQDADAYSCIEAVYGVSAGGFNGAYFLSRQSRLGSSIYYEDLAKDFIKVRHLPYGILQRLWHRFVRPISLEKMKNVVNIDRLMQAARSGKRLDTQKIKQQGIPLYIRLLNAESGEVIDVDARAGNIFALLQATVSAAPYFFARERIGGKLFIDPGIKEPIGLQSIIQRHPDSKIIIQLNRRYASSPLVRPIFAMEKAILSVMHGRHIGKAYARHKKRRQEDKQLATALEQVMLIEPDEQDEIPPYSTDPKVLAKSYAAGMRSGLKALAFMREP